MIPSITGIHYVLERMPALRSPFAERHALYALVEIEATELELMRRLKTALDPHGILNAARVLPD